MEQIKEEFKRSLSGYMTEKERVALISALEDTPASVAVRVNPGKGVSVPAGARLVPWCRQGFYLAERASFTFDPLFHAGAYYVQDASSMFVTHMIRSLIDRPVRYLDLCAAPGGKTTAAVDALPDGSLVVANEVVPTRARTLADNATKWGSENVIVTSDTPARLGRLEGVFDVVAADVPCSGEGMMRKDEQAAAQWSPRLVEECAERQRGILADVWPALRPGGLLIYSTCTFNREENERMVEYLISTFGAEPVEVPTDPEWNIAPGIDADFPCYRFLPHRTEGEGLFMAVLRKTGDAPAARMRPVKFSASEVARWLRDPEALAFVDTPDGVTQAVARDRVGEYALLTAKCRVLQAGVAVAQTKGRKTVPCHALAMAARLNRDAFATVDLDYAAAVAYLRGEAPRLGDAPRGFVLPSFRGLPLGFANNLGPRANNLYPKPLRILSSHAPASPPAVIPEA